MTQKTPYETIGKERLWELVNAFYKRVHVHPDLKPIFPDDLTETIRKQNQFLTQFLGGPPLYSEEHGHPMLRARHLPFKITPKRANAWLFCMYEAMDEIQLEEPIRTFFYGHLEKVAHHMINTYQEEDGQKGE